MRNGMSTKNVDPVLRTFAAWNGRDRAALRREMWPDVRVHATFAGTERRFEGPTGALAWANDIQTGSIACELVADHIRETAERVVVLGSLRCHDSARAMTQPASWIFHLREGKVDELRIHVPPGEVLDAVGVAPAG
jgi:ketosteroid isomerase-like protein